jgi:glutamate racemase
MIGVFDSGVGGLTVVRALLEHLPGQDIIYLGDTARTPYGSKSSRTIIKYALNSSRFLIQHGATILVIACNTVSSYAYETLCSAFNIPVLDVVTPGVKLAVELSKSKRVGIIGTRATIASAVYEKGISAIAPEAKIFGVACPLLVPLVEEGWLKRPETAMIVRKYLAGLKSKHIDTLILGCTHYPVLRKLIQRKIGRRVRLVDSAEAIAMQIRHHPRFQANLSLADPPSTGQCRIFVTDTAEQFQKSAQMILGKKVPVEQADI